MKYSDLKVGQKVRLKIFEEINKTGISETYYSWSKYCGKTTKIIGVGATAFFVEVDGGRHTWYIKDINFDWEKLELI